MTTRLVWIISRSDWTSSGFHLDPAWATIVTRVSPDLRVTGKPRHRFRKPHELHCRHFRQATKYRSASGPPAEMFWSCLLGVCHIALHEAQWSLNFIF